jgi:hypothetical protein
VREAVYERVLPLGGVIATLMLRRVSKDKGEVLSSSQHPDSARKKLDLSHIRRNGVRSIGLVAPHQAALGTPNIWQSCRYSRESHDVAMEQQASFKARMRGRFRFTVPLPAR